MKKIIVIILALAFIVTPAKSQASQTASLFDASIALHGTILDYKKIVFIDQAAFDTYSPGIVVLQNNVFSAVNYSGLIKVTVKCYQPYPYAYLYFYGVTNKSYLIDEGQERWYTMEFIAVSPFKIGIYTDSQTDNYLRCSLLAEAMK
jgi:hypothetical protein